METAMDNLTATEKAVLRHDARQALARAKRHAESAANYAQAAADLYEQAGDQAAWEELSIASREIGERLSSVKAPP